MPSSSVAAQRGATLLESLVAFFVLAVGEPAAAQLQGAACACTATWRGSAREAVRLGARELESLRAWSVARGRLRRHAYAAIVDAETTVDADADPQANTDYRIVRGIDDAGLRRREGRDGRRSTGPTAAAPRSGSSSTA